jgi:hypothetical protein
MGPNRRPKGVYLAVCAIYRDEAPYLREWVAFHRLVGVDHFYLYNNRSTDDHLDALAPYLDDGTVVVRDWRLYPGQVAAYEDCISRDSDHARWIAIIDVDEFLFSPTGKQVSEVLVDYEAWPGVGVNRAVFGTSGHRTRPPGLVIENYLYRASDANSPLPIKSIVDPTRVTSCHSSHSFLYRDGLAVDENKRAIDRPYAHAETMSRSILRVNHYWTKSEREWQVKFDKPDARGKLRRGAAWEKALGGVLNEVRDETIARYLPALRKALAEDGRKASRGTEVPRLAGSE